MTVGDIILVTCIETGQVEKRYIASKMAGICMDNKNEVWYEDGKQFTARTEAPTYTCKLLGKPRRVRPQRGVKITAIYENGRLDKIGKTIRMSSCPSYGTDIEKRGRFTIVTHYFKSVTEINKKNRFPKTIDSLIQ